MEKERVLVTGAAGFIGYHVSQRLLADATTVYGLDNLSDYYDVRLKEARLERLRHYDAFEFRRLDVADRAGVKELFETIKVDRVVHLAAQAGVRHSLDHPHVYVDSNLVGFVNVLEGCRHAEIDHLVFASSSSVYGANERQPFSVADGVDHPLSLYAATKKANEVIAHSYSSLYGVPTTGLRFFTVYGPWGRPDMALFIFANAILEGRPIDVYNRGDMRRDFTYIDDIVEGIVRVLRQPPIADDNWSGSQPDPSRSFAPFRLYNIGRGEPVALMEFIRAIEEELGTEAQKNLLPMQPGDVPSTHADIRRLTEDTGYQPQISVREGVRRFVEWYRDYNVE